MKAIFIILLFFLSLISSAQQTNFNYFDEDSTLLKVNSDKCRVKRISFEPKNIDFNYFDLYYKNDGRIDSCLYTNLLYEQKILRNYSYFTNGQIKGIDSKVLDKIGKYMPFTLKKFDNRGNVTFIEINNAQVNFNKIPISTFSYDSQNRLVSQREDLLNYGFIETTI
jgi:hypothetical protein